MFVKFCSNDTQHDQLESNLKKILHSSGIWGLEAIVMYFHQPISKKSVSVAPVLCENSQNLAFESEITERTKFFQYLMKKIY